MEQSLYEKFGGIEGLTPVVEEFYKRVLADETVNSFFNETNMEMLRKHQTHFLSFALGGPNQYTGKSMEHVHRGLNLQPAHFQAIVLHLHDTLESFKVEKEDIVKVIAVIALLQDSILNK